MQFFVLFHSLCPYGLEQYISFCAHSFTKYNKSNKTSQDEELPVPRAPHLSHVSPAPGPLPYQSFRPVQPSPNNQPPNNQTANNRPANNQPPNQSFRPVQPPVAQPAGNSAPPVVPLPVIVTPNAPVPPATTRKQNGEFCLFVLVEALFTHLLQYIF